MSLMGTLERKLTSEIEPALAGVAPGVQIQVHSQGKKIVDLSVGETFPYYDLASLTKIIFTTQAFIMAFEEERWNLRSTVAEFCPWFAHSQIRIIDLLNHSSGLVWWMPFYQQLDLQTSILNRWTEGARLIRGLALEKPDISVYSDVGFILAGHVLESLYSLPLIEVWSRMKERFYGKTTLDFHQDNQPLRAVKHYAPTERCAWRGKVIQGEVHDDNAWAFGGVSTHAGLFGSIDDVGWYALFLRAQVQGFAKTGIKPKTAKLFTQRSRPMGKGDWALGYMMPTPGSSSSGHHFSPVSIGHTGFTGTSIWYDPTQDLSVVMLSNRVFYGRDNKAFANLRPQIHNWILEGLKRV